MQRNEQLFLAEGDLWQLLSKEERPLVIYGMGNGADKLIDRLAAIGKEPAAIFASDGFVRGQVFHGFRVCRFADVVAQFPDFVILVSFGTRVPEVMAILFDMAEKYPLFLPDMPVAGEQDFTAALCKANAEKIQAVYEMLADEQSKQIFSSVLRYKLSGDIRHLKNAHSTEDEAVACLAGRDIKTAVDGGAYTGDTARQMIDRLPGLQKIYAIEPDVKNYKKLTKFAAEQDEGVQIISINAALWSATGSGCFAASGNRNSSLLSSSYEHKEITVPLLTVDDLAKDEHIDFIKYDVEGAEREALLGSAETIRRDRPALAVSLYHRSEDLFDLPLLIHDILPDYRFYLRRVNCLPAWEITLYAV